MAIKKSISFSLSCLLLVVSGLFVLPFFSQAEAGLGVSPADIIDYNLKPGGHLEKQIIISRSEPNQDMQAVVEADLGDMDSWFQFKPSRKFILPAGEKQVPLKIIVDVPAEAEIKEYLGSIRLKLSSIEEDQSGLAIVKGAKMEVEFITTDVDLRQLLVRALAFQPQYYQDQFQLYAKIENQGNVSAKLDKIELEVSTLAGEKITDLVKDQGFAEIQAQTTAEQKIEFDHQLEPGEYFVNTKLFFEDNLIKEKKLLLKVLAEKSENNHDNKAKQTLLIVKKSPWRWVAMGLLLLMSVISGRNVWNNYKLRRMSKKEKFLQKFKEMTAKITRLYAKKN